MPNCRAPANIPRSAAERSSVAAPVYERGGRLARVSGTVTEPTARSTRPCRSDGHRPDGVAQSQIRAPRIVDQPCLDLSRGRRSVVDQRTETSAVGRRPRARHPSDGEAQLVAEAGGTPRSRSVRWNRASPRRSPSGRGEPRGRRSPPVEVTVPSRTPPLTWRGAGSTPRARRRPRSQIDQRPSLDQGSPPPRRRSRPAAPPCRAAPDEVREVAQPGPVATKRSRMPQGFGPRRRLGAARSRVKRTGDLASSGSNHAVQAGSTSGLDGCPAGGVGERLGVRHPGRAPVGE